LTSLADSVKSSCRLDLSLNTLIRSRSFERKVIAGQRALKDHIPLDVIVLTMHRLVVYHPRHTTSPSCHLATALKKLRPCASQEAVHNPSDLALQYRRPGDLVLLSIAHRLALAVVNAHQDTWVRSLVGARETDSRTRTCGAAARDLELSAAPSIISIMQPIERQARLTCRIAPGPVCSQSATQ